MSSISSTVLIHVRDLVKQYSADSTSIPVLQGINLTIPEGERIALLGKSGCGKSTLLNLIGGLDVPTSGSVEIRGKDLAKLNANDRATYRLKTVGMIFQAFYLIPSQTAWENVELPMIFAGIPRLNRKEMAREALEAVGLGHRLNHFPNQLSGGERQRVAIARALVNQPEILLADEPTGNLDSTTGKEIIDLLMTHLDRHQSTLILVTHDEELARRCATRMLRMNDGRIV